MHPVRLLYQGIDQTVPALLTQALTNHGAVGHPASGRTEGPAPAIAIVDCRQVIEPPHRDCCVDPTIPAVALACAEQFDRQAIFAAQYQDFLLWPPVDAEIRARIMAVLALWDRERRHPATAADRLTEAACRIMREHLDRPISLSRLVARLGTNRTTLGARFQARFGQSPLAWLRAERMRHAAQLLAGTRLAVAEVAAAVGYEDSNNFATAFRRHHGVAPRVFRKNCTAQRKSCAAQR